MQQIADWLKQLGLGQYAQRFAENDINFAILRHLTDQDLKELGVASLGHRRQLLLAIAELNGVEKGIPKPATAATAPIAPHDTAERRQVTVMFSDLVGSTALSARMDPEDLREVISSYQKCVAETVQRLGGFVAKYMGDGVLVYFGFPMAHEDDAERAVRAGLELVAGVGGLKTHAPLQTRVGIATGLVVVGDLIGSGASQEQAIVGETPNLAARLQGIAEPNGVVIAEGTRKLLGSLFELDDLGAKDLKGIAEPVRAWAALRPASVEGRFEAMHTTGLTALVGRDEELELLLRRWSKAKAGEGQVVLLSGEAGIGKSRLAAALLERLASEPLTRLRYFCSPQHTDSAFYPIIRQMERAAGITHDDALPTKLDKLDAMLAQSSTSAHDAALFAEMLSLPNDGRYPPLDPDPQRRRQGTLEALNLQMEILSRSNPVLMIIEDVHWSDPTSLEAFGRAVDRVASHRVLLLVTFRPEFEPPWIGRPYVTFVAINRLGERDIAAMIDGVTGNKLIPSNIRQDIIERTDGIPLFVEEMTKAVLEAESEGTAEQTAAAVPSPALAVPASLHASLMARLDRLGSAKEIAQIGSVIGREFSHALLAAVVRKPEAELQSALDGLVEAGLLFRQAMPPSASYLFKHALVQDAAYGTLLREPRRTLHSRIAQAVESQFGELAENQPELLARHYTEAGLTEKAIRYWLIAGRKSAARSAMLEAVRHMHRGLELVPILPAGPSRLRYELEFQSALGGALIAAKGASAAETGEAYYRARHLCQELGDTELLISVLSGLSTYHIARNEFGPARDVAEHLLHIAQTRRDAEVQLVANRAMGACLCHLGEFTSSAAYLLRALSLYAPEKHRSIASVAGYDARVSALNWLMIDLFALGQLDAAAARSSEVLQWSRELRYPNSTCFALALAVIHQLLRRAYDGTGELMDQLTTVAKDQDFPFWRVVADIIRGYLIAAQGQPLSGLELSQRGLAEYNETGAKWMEAYFLYLISQCCEMADRMEEAVRVLDTALRTIDISGERWFAAELYRMKGDLSIAHSRERLAQTEVDYQHALQIARQQSAKSWQLRASMSLARLWRDQGKVSEARELLAPVYGWFTEGFDTRDLKEAKALLEELSA